MDYHSDRFEDHSLIAFRKGKPVALLPANRCGSVLWSHQGLTYGGWILPPGGPDTGEIFTLWKKWLEYCRDRGIEKIVYKPLPHIYSSQPSEEDRYMLFLSGANLISTDISTAIDLKCNSGFNKLQKRHLSHAPEDFNIKVAVWEDSLIVDEFYRVLRGCLEERHNTTPVHSLEEIKLLMKTFPEKIHIWTGRLGHEVHAGICAFAINMCLHCQYIATTTEGRERNIMAPLIKEMISYYTGTGTRYFDFGISNEDGGRRLNVGLNRQKTSYGGTGVAYSRYEINVSSALESLPTSLWPQE